MKLKIHDIVYYKGNKKEIVGIEYADNGIDILVVKDTLTGLIEDINPNEVTTEDPSIDFNHNWERE